MTDQALWSASAPGKVLICGGYLIVEPGNEGLSIGVSARFTTKVIRTEVDDKTSGFITVFVNSPQFGKTFEFRVAQENPDSGPRFVSVTQVQGPNSPFLHNAVLYTFSHLSCKTCPATEAVALDAKAGRVWELDLLADNPFYSQRNFLAEKKLPVTVENLRKHVPQHQPLIGEVSKTGLGSSAALTTSLVACLHYQYGVGTSGDLAQKESIHRVGQIAHSIAQGKVGSGFDVYTAVYGTCIYSRFNPAVVVDLMKSHNKEGSDAQWHGDSNTVFPDLLSAVVSEESSTGMWVKPRAFTGLPRGCALLLADVHQGGSQTPGMVSSIMKWKAAAVEAHPEDNLWAKQKALNSQYLAAMEALSVKSRQDESKSDWDKAVMLLSSKAGTDWDMEETEVKGVQTFIQGLVQLRKHAQAARENLKEIGRLSGVEVEPEVLTPLLDKTSVLPGVLASGCPGAGGFDALFAIVLDPSCLSNSAEQSEGGNCAAVEKFWESCDGMSVCPLVVREDPAGGLTASHTKN